MNNSEEYSLLQLILRYAVFWPFFLLTFIVLFAGTFIYLRYSESVYISNAKIEIIDKAEDSEMALPTSMTIFNRSMINLENEIGVLNSFKLHLRTVKKINANINYFSKGKIKTTENHYTDFYNNFELDFLIDTDTLKSSIRFDIYVNNNNLMIDQISSENDIIKSYFFKGKTTKNKQNDLPFDLSYKNNFSDKKIIVIQNPEETATRYQSFFSCISSGNQSDQLSLSFTYPNKKVASEYLNALIFEFDSDGISDRQLEYQRTMNFVDDRSIYLEKELSKIEKIKQEFKENNNLTDIASNASSNVDQQFSYDSELFKMKSQRRLVEMLTESLKNQDKKLLPVNIGIENTNINKQINDYNLIIKERERLLLSAGQNNYIILNYNKQIDEFLENLNLSIENFINALDVKISEIESKEIEFEKFYKSVPENERILRSIERELEIKEQLFLLLLQKREEAAINFAVVKPSIKIIDNAKTNSEPIAPRPIYLYAFAALSSLAFPIMVLAIRFFFDNKIHIRDDLEKITNIPILAEIPYIKSNQDTLSLVSSTSRDPLAESIRILLANLKYSFVQKKSNVILVTSSIKGEGKTLISVNLASALSQNQNKVILIGADLRNPQLHKFYKIKKDVTGLSDHIYKNDVEVDKIINKTQQFHTIFSGTIPPNPTELLSSEKFKLLIEGLKSKYDNILIDSAPSLLVSDTYEIAELVDSTLFVVRSNHTERKLINFINQAAETKRFKNVNFVLNGIGASSSYGYKYGYQYSYKYGYKYSYNYGYGYGYNESEK